MSSQAPGAVTRPRFPASPPIDQMKDMYIGQPQFAPPPPPFGRGAPPVWPPPTQGAQNLSQPQHPQQMIPPPVTSSYSMSPAAGSTWRPPVAESFSQAPPVGSSFSAGPPFPQSFARPQGPPPTFSRPPPGPPVTSENFARPPFPSAPPSQSQGPPPSFRPPAENYGRSQGLPTSFRPPGPPTENYGQSQGLPPSFRPTGPPTWAPQPQAQNIPPGPPSAWNPPPQGPPAFGNPSWNAPVTDNFQGQMVPPVPPSFGNPPNYAQGHPMPPSFGAPVIPQPGSPMNAPVSGASRVDPSQIPRPQENYGLSTFDTVSNSLLPPSATSNFLVRDLGNCSPKIMRSTLYQIPCSGDLVTSSKMPLALLVQPLAIPHVDEEPIQVVDFGETGPVRCIRCKAYINPFVKFVDQGRRFTCNLCGHSNETPRDYFCNLGPDGRRRDVDERPELSRGTVEFVATREYMVRPPMPQVFFFLVDVSAQAIKTGAVAAACSAIQKALSDIPEGRRTLVGVATFDSTIHFYNIRKQLQQPSMLIVPDIHDVYVPIGNGLLVPISEGREHMETLLENIPNMFQDNQNQESALGAALKASFLALKPTGGKLLVFQSVLPSIGLGALSPREAEWRNAGEKDAHKVFQPVDKTLKSMAEDFSISQVCVDLFLTTQSYVDIASLSVVPLTTGGQVYYYFPFSATMDSAKLYNDLRWNLTRPQGLEAVMRVRCSQGLKVQDYYGSCKRVSTDLDLPAIDCDKSILVTFKHEDKFQEGAECCFQSALLYTTPDGQRRIRVSTLSLTCTNVLSNLFKGADLDAQFTYLLKQAAQSVPTSPLSQVKEQAITQCVQSLFSYRKFCATATSAAQLILPEGLKLLPLYTLALTKSVGLRQDARVDERSYWIVRATCISAALAIPLVYPRMFAAHNIQELGDPVLPPMLPLSSENLDPEGIFLLETGEDAFLYAGKSVSSELLHQLFEVRSVDEVVPGQFSLQEHPNEPSILLNKMVNEIRRQRCSYLRLHLLKRGDPSEVMFQSFMVEDKTPLGPSYVEFLVYMHRQIQTKMSAGN